MALPEWSGLAFVESFDCMQIKWNLVALLFCGKYDIYTEKSLFFTLIGDEGTILKLYVCFPCIFETNSLKNTVYSIEAFHKLRSSFREKIVGYFF